MRHKILSKIHQEKEKRLHELHELQLSIVRHLRGKSGKSLIDLQITEVCEATGDGAA